MQVSVDQARCLLPAIYEPPKALTANQGIQCGMTRRHGCSSRQRPQKPQGGHFLTAIPGLTTQRALFEPIRLDHVICPPACGKTPKRNDREASTLPSGMISRAWIPPGTVRPVTLIRQRPIMEPAPAGYGGARHHRCM